MGSTIRNLTTLFLVLDLIGMIVGFVFLIIAELFLVAIISLVLGICISLLLACTLYAIADIHDKITYMSYSSTKTSHSSNLLKSTNANSPTTSTTTVYTAPVNTPSATPTPATQAPASKPSQTPASAIDYATYIKLKQQLNKQDNEKN